MSRPQYDPLADEGILIVDLDWRVVSQAGAIHDPEISHAPSPASIEWTPLSGASSFVTKPTRGKITLSDGQHLALACPLKSGEGYLLIHQPLAAVTIRPDSLAAFMPAISGATLIWVGTLLGVLMYIILMRSYARIHRNLEASATDASCKAQALVRTRDAVIFGLAKLADSRDPNTGQHLERIAAYSTTLASAARRHPRFGGRITQPYVKLIGISSVLHDIGKVGIEDRILLKADSLTPEERERMKAHTIIGGRCLEQISRRLGCTSFLGMAHAIALSHHERWDGTGYPQGLSGEAIPLSARIVAIADVYDALSSARAYKAAMPHERCVEFIQANAGTHFDPTLVQVWLEVEHRFRQIAVEYGNDVAQEPFTVASSLEDVSEHDEKGQDHPLPFEVASAHV